MLAISINLDTCLNLTLLPCLGLPERILRWKWYGYFAAGSSKHSKLSWCARWGVSSAVPWARW